MTTEQHDKPIARMCAVVFGILAALLFASECATIGMVTLARIEPWGAGMLAFLCLVGYALTAPIAVYLAYNACSKRAGRIAAAFGVAGGVVGAVMVVGIGKDWWVP